MSGKPGSRELERPCHQAKTQLVQIENTAPAYWSSIEDLQSGRGPRPEFPGGLPSSSGKNVDSATRRDFLAMAGFTVAVAALTGCRAPVQNAIPLLVGSDEIIPGVANYYATTCRGCASSCSLLVKQRDGRPIKIEGNSLSALFGGGTCATGQATVLNLYDDARLRGPMWHGHPATWEEVDQHVLASLDAARASNGKIVLLSQTINSPSTLAIIHDWAASNQNFRHVTYDPVSFSAMREANRQSFGVAAVPHYRFDRARVIVALEADFLGTWLSPVEFSRQYTSTRSTEGHRALHVQFESGLSVTGSNADVRVAVPPSQLGEVAAALLHRVARKAGAGALVNAPEPHIDRAQLDLLADELWKHHGESLVVSGSNDVHVQKLVNALNACLNNIGWAVDLERPSYQRTGDDVAMRELLEEMNRGDVHALLMYGVNPAYDYHEAALFARGLEKVGLSVSFADRSDETSSRAQAICPDHHFLEAWGDAEPVDSYLSLAQPLIAPLFATRAAQESLLRWSGNPTTDYYAYLRAFWTKNVFPKQKAIQNADAFWERSLQDGVLEPPQDGKRGARRPHAEWSALAQPALYEYAARTQHSNDQTELHLYESVALRDGRHANNPWLQELPDPVSKVTWGNYAAVSPQLAKAAGLSDGDVLILTTERGAVKLPALVQPGQEARTVSVALGYGRTLAGKVGSHVGSNVYGLSSPTILLSPTVMKIEKTGRKQKIASTQSHFSLEGRAIVLETTLQELQSQPDAGPEQSEVFPSLWADRLQGEHAWGMAIDMNACTGCSACVVACQAENNVPVVGRDQVERARIMHWIRIDRYYAGSADAPTTVHQPMMCQHCQNAPCETVCPVLATTTSSEGLNQQVYNRCIGTRYCANNCPYKVRRFNWYNYTDNSDFDFNMVSPLGRMVLNPDVVVRSRGVMEKCTMCVQRIQLAKNIALQGRRPLADGDIQTACQQVCPTQAIVFGDLKDPSSRVSQLQRSRRSYQVLDELGVRPNVSYLKRVRNAVKET